MKALKSRNVRRFLTSFSAICLAIPMMSMVSYAYPMEGRSVAMPDVSDVNILPPDVNESRTIQLEIGVDALSLDMADAQANAAYINDKIAEASSKNDTAGVWQVRFPVNAAYQADYDTYNPAAKDYPTVYDDEDVITIPTTSIELKSNVVVNIPKGVLIQASTIPNHWPVFDSTTDVERDDPYTQPRRSVFYGVSLENVAIMGQGIVDGAGPTYYFTSGNESGEFKPGFRPQSIIYIRDSSNVNIYDIILRNSVRWTCVLELNNNVHVKGMAIRNPIDQLGRETDGIDINTTSNIVVEYCDIETGDDSVCIKPQRDYFQGPAAPGRPATARPTMPARTQHDIVVRNCKLATTCNTVKIGTGTYLDLNRVYVHDIIVNKHSKAVANDDSSGLTTTAISVQTNDGANISDITYRNFTVNDCDTGIFIGAQQRQRPNAYVNSIGKVKNILFDNINIIRSERASQINMQKNAPIIEDITFKDVKQFSDENYIYTSTPPWMKGGYPDADGFGSMPAYGLFARGVNGLYFEGNNSFIDGKYNGTYRPMFVFDRVEDYSGAILDANEPEILDPDADSYTRFPFQNGGGTYAYVEAFNGTRPSVGGAWVARNNTARDNFAYNNNSQLNGESAIAKANTNAREYLALNIQGAADWENYHIHMKVWPGSNVWKEAANTQILYRIPSNALAAHSYRDKHMAVSFARSNKGYIRINQRGLPDDKQLMQLGYSPIANPAVSGVPDDIGQKFYDVDIVVDGPYISIYIDGEEFIKDFYDPKWNDDWKKGTIGIGGNAPGSQYADIKIMLIQQSKLITKSTSFVQHSLTKDVKAEVEFNGNEISKILEYKPNATKGRKLTYGIDYTFVNDGVIISKDYLNSLPEGDTRLDFVFNLSSESTGNNEYKRERTFMINVQ